jgi:hypothetical protein
LNHSSERARAAVEVLFVRGGSLDGNGLRRLDFLRAAFRLQRRRAGDRRCAEGVPKFSVLVVARARIVGPVVAAHRKLRAAVGELAPLAPAVAVIVNAGDESRIARIRLSAARLRH